MMGECKSREGAEKVSGSARRPAQPQRTNFDQESLLGKLSQCTGRLCCNSKGGGTFFLVTSAERGFPRLSLLTAAHVIRPLLGDTSVMDEASVKKAIQSKSLGFQIPESNSFPEIRFSGKDLDPKTFFYFSPPRKLNRENLDFLWVAVSRGIAKKLSNRNKLNVGQAAASDELAKKGETVLGAMFLHKSEQIIPSFGRMVKDIAQGDKIGQYQRGGARFDEYMRENNGAGGASGSPIMRKKAGNDFLFGLHYKKGHFTLIETILSFVKQRLSRSDLEDNKTNRQRRRSRSQTPRQRSQGQGGSSHPHTPRRRGRSENGARPPVVRFEDGKRRRPFIWVEAKRVQKARGFVKSKWLVDTGASRSAISEEVARKLKLLERGKVVIRNATAAERRALVRLQVRTLLSGKPSDRLLPPTSICELEVTIRGGGIKHSILGMDWISKVKPTFKYPD
eukprot:jgi/Bigna1/86735/estExt_fgenesh1_pg.C_130105